MKDIITNISTAIILAILLIANTYAQDADFLKTQELASFNQVELDMDTEVILLKSSRNHISLVGELDYINSMPVTVNGDTLSLNYNRETNPKLRRVVIEYQNISQIKTNGTGVYHFHKVDQDSLKIINNNAKITMNGSINNVRIISENGDVDATNLKSNKMIANMGTTSQLQLPTE